MFTAARSVIRAAVRRRAGIIGQTNAHPDADLSLDIDDSYRELRDLCTRARYGTFLTSTSAASLPTTPPVAGEQYVELTSPSGAIMIRGVDVQPAVDWIRAEEVAFEMLRSVQPNRWQGSRRYWWTLLNSGTVATSVYTTGKIALFPIPQGGNYKVWYLPEFAATTQDSDVYLYHTDVWQQWHIQSVVQKVAQQDNDSNNTAKMAAEKLVEYEAKIRAGTPTASGPAEWGRARDR